MSTLRKIKAIFCSDIHASSTPPVFRSDESNWFDALLNPLNELKSIQKENGNPPIIIAGDVFDVAKTSPDIINLLLRELPENIYAIPGQHDLPYHNFDDIGLSSFETLVLAGKIKLLNNKFPIEIDEFKIYGFPWEFDITPPKNDDYVKIAVIHKYIWMNNHSYQDAPSSNHIKSSFYEKKLRGFNIAVFGDNHSGFTSRLNDTLIYNCGCFIRRKQDEITYKPSIGLLTSEGKIKRHFLNCENDKYSAITKQLESKQLINSDELINELSNITDINLDIDNFIQQELAKEKVHPETKKFINELLEEVK